MKTLNSSIAEVRIVYKTNVKASDRQQIKCSKDSYELFMETWVQKPDAMTIFRRSDYI